MAQGTAQGPNGHRFHSAATALPLASLSNTGNQQWTPGRWDPRQGAGWECAPVQGSEAQVRCFESGLEVAQCTIGRLYLKFLKMRTLYNPSILWRSHGKFYTFSYINYFIFIIMVNIR